MRPRTLPALLAGLGLLLASAYFAPAQEEKPRRKVVLIAGKKSHGPVGNGVHDYGWSVRLLKVMLDSSNVKDRLKVEYHLDGWARDPKTLDTADAIMIVSDGRDGDLYEEAPHLASEERVRYLDGLVKKGCGVLTVHFSTFAPEKYREQVLDWYGGYFQWETDGKRQWYSAIKTLEAEVKPANPDHPVARGVRPFKMREEFYHNLRFRAKDETVKPILEVPALKGRAGDGNVVAWVREGAGGRGFGTTCGHFYDNWKNDDFRKTVLNAITWAAKAEVPKDGVESRFFTHDEIDKALGPMPGAEKPIRALMLAGNDAHKWHNWERTTPAIKEALERDPRVRVDVVLDFEELAKRDLSGYDLIVQNWCNWQDPRGSGEKAKTAFAKFVRDGGGLVVIHFANGAFHPSLPKAAEADWPEYRRIVRRVWNHTPPAGKKASGHDAFGTFTVRFTDRKHPITDGLKPFEVTDELYHDQDGDEPIEPLLVADSKNTKGAEPLAWTYEYGKGRVFQTLLGHSEKTYDAFEAREMLRRAAAWVAKREVRPLKADR
jgi:type 1 glutamine amidotransferase